MRMFAIYDVKAEIFTAPHFMRTVGEAVRGFSMEVQNPDSMLSKWPDDYVLYEVGEFDQVTGALVARETPYKITSGFECKPRGPQMADKAVVL